MQLSNRYAKARKRMWDRHQVTIRGEAKRTATGVTYGEPQCVMASVNISNRTVTNLHGEDVIVAATIRWAPTGPLPKLGALIDLPEYFGVKPGREVITAGRFISGTGLTPDHVEVTVK